MKRTTMAPIAAVALLTLTGCAESTGNATAERSTVEAAETAAPPIQPNETSEPLIAQESEDASSTESQFLVEARDRLSGLGAATTIPDATDEQLITAGKSACGDLLSGTPFVDVSVIEGEERVQGSYLDSAAIATAGLLFFCPELNGATN